MLGDQPEGKPVATTQDAQHNVLTTDGGVLVRQCFSQAEQQDLLGGPVESDMAAAATPARSRQG